MANEKEKLIELLERSQTDFNSGGEMRFVGGDVMPAVRRAIEKTEQNQKWIPVTERLPKHLANKVIVRCKNDYIGFGHYEDYKGKQTWYNLESDKPFTDWNHEDCESYEVTHWMPLPEPPKEDA